MIRQVFLLLGLTAMISHVHAQTVLMGTVTENDMHTTTAEIDNVGTLTLHLPDDARQGDAFLTGTISAKAESDNVKKQQKQQKQSNKLEGYVFEVEETKESFKTENGLFSLHAIPEDIHALTIKLFDQKGKLKGTARIPLVKKFLDAHVPSPELVPEFKLPDIRDVHFPLSLKTRLMGMPIIPLSPL